MENQGIKNVMKWVIGISSLALILLVILIIFGNLSGNMGITNTNNVGYTNESGHINYTNPYTPAGVSVLGYISFTINEVYANVSGEGYFVPSTNYTTSGDTIVNATEIVDLDEYQDAYITYTATYRSGEYLQAEGVIGNVTYGVSRLTAQFPIILLLAGIGLLLFILIGVLAWVIRKMSSLNMDSVKGKRGVLE